MEPADLLTQASTPPAWGRRRIRPDAVLGSRHGHPPAVYPSRRRWRTSPRTCGRGPGSRPARSSRPGVLFFDRDGRRQPPEQGIPRTSPYHMPAVRDCIPAARLMIRRFGAETLACRQARVTDPVFS